jgi:hypothetical protein
MPANATSNLLPLSNFLNLSELSQEIILAHKSTARIVEEKLAAAEQLMLAAQKEIFAAIEALEDDEDDTAGAQKLFKSTGALIRATFREKTMVKHYGTAPKTAAISRSI